MRLVVGNRKGGKAVLRISIGIVIRIVIGK